MYGSDKIHSLKYCNSFHVWPFSLPAAAAAAALSSTGHETCRVGPTAGEPDEATLPSAGGWWELHLWLFGVMECCWELIPISNPPFSAVSQKNWCPPSVSHWKSWGFFCMPFSKVLVSNKDEEISFKWRRSLNIWPDTHAHWMVSVMCAYGGVSLSMRVPV